MRGEQFWLGKIRAAQLRPGYPLERTLMIWMRSRTSTARRDHRPAALDQGLMSGVVNKHSEAIIRDAHAFLKPTPDNAHARRKLAASTLPRW
jgi:hypothetical protein